MKKTILFLFIASIVSFTSIGQNIKRALFLGNSYTYVNSLPVIIAALAHTTGESLYYDSNTPGSYTLQLHSVNATSLGKIMTGGWDYVVLQEQSQLPSFPIGQVDSSVFPYAHKLDSIIKVWNPCGSTMFYMTWGREYGDSSNCAAWPPVCTYAGMDSLLQLRYMMMADSNQALVSPVGAVWKYIRQNFPLINLYQSDQSHPSLAGSYAAACCFYTTIFRKDPSLINDDYTLSAADAANIRTAAKAVVWDSLLKWHIGEFDPVANFSFATSANNTVTFSNTSDNALNYTWYFGDGDSSVAASPVHIYATSGTYNVMLIAYHCHMSDTITETVNASMSGIENFSQQNKISFYPNPVNDEVTIVLKNSNVEDVSIIECSGQTHAAKYSSDGNTIKIDFSTFSAGIYFVKINDDGLVMKIKVVKK